MSMDMDGREGPSSSAGGIQLVLRGLEESQRDLEGAVAILSGELTEEGMWPVEISLPCGNPKSMLVEPAKLCLEEDAFIQSLRSRPVVIRGGELDSREARCGPYRADCSRFIVHLGGDGSTPLLMEPSALLCKVTGEEMSCPFCEVDIEGKGKGLASTARFKAGQVVFTEEAIAACQRAGNYVGDFIYFANAYKALDRAQKDSVLQLSVQNSIMVKGLQGELTDEHIRDIFVRGGCQIPSEEAADVVKAARIFHTNTLEGERGCQCLYRNISRINHSCCPNCVRVQKLVGGKQHMDVFAVRDIEPGEELTISYVGDMYVCQPRIDRQARLSRWSFACSCSVCSIPEERFRAFECANSGCKGTAYVITHEGHSSNLGTCSTCGAAAPNETAMKMLEFEAEIISLHRDLQENSGGKKYADVIKCVATALKKARNGRLSELHYAVAGLHDIAWDFNNHTGNLEEALKHSSSHLHFWEAHLDRLSIRKSRERVAQAQLLVRMGRYKDAFKNYSMAFVDIQGVSSADSRELDDIRVRMRRVLDGRKTTGT